MTDEPQSIAELVAELRDLHNLFEGVPGPRGQESRYARLRAALVSAAEALECFDAAITAEESRSFPNLDHAPGDGA